MEEKFKEIVNLLTENDETIATMESCTGGAVASVITDVEGASKVLKFSAVTYSNEYKIKMGVDAKVIDEYSVYSMETAREMSKNISDFANSSYGVGITGKLNRADEANDFGKDNEIFVSIYVRKDGKYYDFSLFAKKGSRKENKNLIISDIADKMLEIIG